VLGVGRVFAPIGSRTHFALHGAAKVSGEFGELC